LQLSLWESTDGETVWEDAGSAGSAHRLFGNVSTKFSFIQDSFRQYSFLLLARFAIGVRQLDYRLWLLQVQAWDNLEAPSVDWVCVEAVLCNGGTVMDDQRSVS
jgi:hypothetical protein